LFLSLLWPIDGFLPVACGDEVSVIHNFVCRYSL
jgi:hypothetical protein